MTRIKEPVPFTQSQCFSLRQYLAQIRFVLSEASGQGPKADEFTSKLLGEWRDPRLLMGLSQAAIQKRAGCSSRQARRLKAILRFSELCLLAPPHSLPKVSSALDAAKLVRGLGFSTVERLWVIALDIQGRVIGVREINRGTFHPGTSTSRNIFSFLLDVRADRGITAQNIGVPELESDVFDHVFVTRLVELGEQLGIPIVDHLIISRDGYQSVAEGGGANE